MTDKTTPSTKRRATGGSAKAGQKRSRAARPAATPLRHHTDAPRATRTRPDMAPDAEARRIAAQAVEAKVAAGVR